jgi:fucokinase
MDQTPGRIEPVRKSGWDYLVVTAANEDQAAAYRTQLELRDRLRLITGVRNIAVVADPGGVRVGSGASTLLCLAEVLGREQAGRSAWEATLRRLRILIVHAGGDARRLPAYSPCGKIFIPVPGESDSALGLTLLDRQLPRYLDLPAAPAGEGQIVVTSGDVILEFDPSPIRFHTGSATGIASWADPGIASRHGVYVPGGDGAVGRFLQKPSIPEQEKYGAVDAHGRTLLDIGVINLDAASACRLLSIFDWEPGGRSRVSPSPSDRGMMEKGIDFYREICCAMGEQTDFGSYRREVRKAGSVLGDAALRRIYRAVSQIRFRVESIPRCTFLHFGTMRELIDSGADLISKDRGVSNAGNPIAINNDVSGAGSISGRNGWVEGCRIFAPLSLGGDNVVTGVDVEEPLALPAGGCVDVLEGAGKGGKKEWFIRCYGVDDIFHLENDRGGRLGGLPLKEWLSVMGATEADVWEPDIPARERTVWNGRLFPAEPRPGEFRRWLWLLHPATATAAEKNAWRNARRYSFAQTLGLVDQAAFHGRRAAIRATEVGRGLRRVFRLESGFSAADLAFLLHDLDRKRKAEWIAEIIRECLRRFDGKKGPFDVHSLELSRILHTVGSAADAAGIGRDALPLSASERAWLESLGDKAGRLSSGAHWAARVQDAAFRHLIRVIVSSGTNGVEPPVNRLRDDEIVWGRAPARFDLCGGWSDTPPYSLEWGGCVLNAAVDLNGQAPIQAYARVIRKREIRIASIDHGVSVAIRSLEDLLDYHLPTSKFALAKAALALSGFSPEFAEWKGGAPTFARILEHFGGGIELTTLAAIPSGSGLGTSSIMGAVLMAVIGRMLGRVYSPKDLFHAVLQLEQELTTGGGWQDQIGGAVEGVKIIRTAAGLIPDPSIRFIRSDVISPQINGGQTLLYYTGIRRLAKNILSDVVSRYLDRNRAALATLREIHALPAVMAEAMAEKSMEQFGGLIGAAWELNNRLDPDSTVPVINGILDLIRPHIHGAKLLGAGGGGFLLIVAASVPDALKIKTLLSENPPNDRARFFEYGINPDGLVVTVC